MKFQELIKDILVESDKRDSIIKAIGFSKEWADEFHSLDEKLSIWIANTFLDEMKGFFPVTTIDREPTIERLNNNGPKLTIWEQDYKLKYRYILDWLRSPRRGSNINLKALNFDQAYAASEKWHDSLESKAAAGYKEKNEIIIDYRNAEGVGYYWANLNTSFSEEEKGRMGHCGNDSGKVLFSLRSIDEYGDGRSHITVSYDVKEKKINQVKGKKNSKPKEEYYPFIIDLIKNEKFPVKGFERRIYGYENNFQLNDLSTDVLNGLFEKNRDLKMDYLFGDKQLIANDEENADLSIFLDASGKSKLYGVINKESLTLVKDFEYVIDNESKYSDILYVDKKPIVIKHFKATKSKDEFIIVQSKTVFKFISKETAQQYIDNDLGIDQYLK